ncbi:hypothetical protein QTI66_19675 [Variovorax sp. J22R133]|uniref:hypothetical protein n=1 Tax=Variovorax brevis TaxID=3053503 RepID=UPI002575A116|nr:hypothetical protein [Variovorax sp. J22R133]MDM0114383.1 hypothetical protein [Variovorax sp. J22R133]
MKNVTVPRTNTRRLIHATRLALAGEQALVYFDATQNEYQVEFFDSAGHRMPELKFHASAECNAIVAAERFISEVSGQTEFATAP